MLHYDILQAPTVVGSHVAPNLVTWHLMCNSKRGHMHTALRSMGPPVAVKDVCACVHPMTGPEDLSAVGM